MAKAMNNNERILEWLRAYVESVIPEVVRQQIGTERADALAALACRIATDAAYMGRPATLVKP